MLSYPCGMSVSSRALTALTDVLRRHRRERATRWRKLAAGRQALPVVAYLRKGETYADLACGFRIGTSTVYRYVREAIELLGGDGPDPDPSGRGRGREGVRDPRRHPAADRPGRHDLGPGSRVLLRKAQVPRRERAGHRRPGRPTGVDLAGAARRSARHGRCPRARHHRRVRRRRGAGGRRPPTRAAAPRSGSRNGVAVWTPTPGHRVEPGTKELT